MSKAKNLLSLLESDSNEDSELFKPRTFEYTQKLKSLVKDSPEKALNYAIRAYEKHSLDGSAWFWTGYRGSDGHGRIYGSSKRVTREDLKGRNYEVTVNDRPGDINILFTDKLFDPKTRKLISVE